MKMARRVDKIRLGLAIFLGFFGAVTAAAEPLNQQSPVSEPFANPAFESVCHLSIKRRVALLFSASYTGSAVLYRGRYLLTAGHNVYQDRSRIRAVTVRCGDANARRGAIDEVIAPWQAIDASDYQGGPFSRDFGVIRLNRPIAVSTPFSLATNPAQLGEALRFAGFPGGPHSGWEMFEARGSLARLTDGLAHYDIETFKSNSGGPVWREVGGQAELLAIHVTNSGGRVVDLDFASEVDRLIAELDRRAAEKGL